MIKEELEDRIHHQSEKQNEVIQHSNYNNLKHSNKELQLLGQEFNCYFSLINRQNKIYKQNIKIQDFISFRFFSSKFQYDKLSQNLKQIKLAYQQFSAYINHQIFQNQIKLQQNSNNQSSKFNKKKYYYFQFFRGKSSLPLKPLIFITINQIKNTKNKLNIVIRNLIGQILYYSCFAKITQISKKIIGNRFPEECLAVIIDNRKNIIDGYDILTILKSKKKMNYIYNFRKYSQLVKSQFDNHQNQYINVIKSSYGLENKVNIQQLIRQYQILIKHQNKFLLLIRGEKNQQKIYFDALLINYYKRLSKKQQQLTISIGQLIQQQFIKQLQNKYQRSMITQSDIQKLHHPQLMETCKTCKVCKVIHKDEKKIFKSKYKCQGCSLLYGVDISLCVQCFKQFHNHKDLYLDQISIKKNQSPQNFNTNEFQNNPIESQNRKKTENLLKNLDKTTSIVFSQIDKLIRCGLLEQSRLALNVIISQLIDIKKTMKYKNN